MFLQTHPVIVATDISEIQVAAARLGLEATLDLLGCTTPFSCTITRVTLGGSELAHCEHSGRLRITGQASPQSYFLCSSRKGEIVFSVGGDTVILSPGNPIVLPERDFVAETSPFAKVVVVKLDRGAVRKALRNLIQRQAIAPLRFALSYKPRHAQKVRLLERYLEFLCEGASVANPTGLLSPLTLAQAENLLSTLLLQTLPNNFSGEIEISSGSPWQLKAADDVIRERLSELTSTSKLAAAIGVSPKALRRAFVQVKGTTPTRYLRQLRFERVRHDLQQAQPPETVTTIAVRWGFYHLGRFAGEYRREFSESPSQTLRAPNTGSAGCEHTRSRVEHGLFPARSNCTRYPCSPLPTVSGMR